MRNSDMVISAWDGEKLIGLINALSDGVMNVYFHYLLVRAEYQSKGVGKQLISSILERRKHFTRKAVIAYDVEAAFYERCGFERGEGKVPLFITYLGT